MQEHRISAAIPFELLFDTDYGIVKFLQLTTTSSDDVYNLMYPGILDMFRDKDSLLMRYILIKRDIVNPLYCIFKKEYLGQLNEMYDSIMKTHLDEILKFSCKTNLLEMVMKSTAEHGDVIKFTVICKNEKERDMMVEYTKSNDVSVPTLLIKDFKYDSYDTIYCKNVYELDDMIEKKVIGKNIIIVDYSFNLDENLGIPKPDQIEDLVIDNKFHVCNLYNFESLKISG